MSVLRKVTDICKNGMHENKAPVVIFDLDSTLFDNSLRTITILREFAQIHDHPKLSTALEELKGKRLPYLIEDILRLTNACDRKTIARGRLHWMDYFFTDEYQKHDMPLDGASSYVNEIFKTGTTVVYLSGRDVPGMLVGCSQSLRTHNFPIASARIVLVLKPSFEMADYKFKKGAVDFIDTLGVVVASFHNEPENCNLFLDKWPKCFSVCLDTNHMPNPPVLRPEVVKINDFTSA